MYLDVIQIICVHKRIKTYSSLTQFRLDIIYNVNKAFLANMITKEYTRRNPGTSHYSNWRCPCKNINLCYCSTGNEIRLLSNRRQEAVNIGSVPVRRSTSQGCSFKMWHGIRTYLNEGRTRSGYKLRFIEDVHIGLGTWSPFVEHCNVRFPVTGITVEVTFHLPLILLF